MQGIYTWNIRGIYPRHIRGIYPKNTPEEYAQRIYSRHIDPPADLVDHTNERSPY